ncbi:conserved hypothetical protein [Coccidioides posadasii str. Silveira]|uniref:Uncharacterized protein n=1 Tax=Coccidioides posadasii (strain RMSCC 757 / Silveira) TaxID=443226 RepID=E9CT31_COCPS|nr:conserved hypothetical protein [Coccidioides posadasii str. Silveira]
MVVLRRVSPIFVAGRNQPSKQASSSLQRELRRAEEQISTSLAGSMAEREDRREKRRKQRKAERIRREAGWLEGEEREEKGKMCQASHTDGGIGHETRDGCSSASSGFTIREPGEDPSPEVGLHQRSGHTPGCALCSIFLEKEVGLVCPGPTRMRETRAAQVGVGLTEAEDGMKDRFRSDEQPKRTRTSFEDASRDAGSGLYFGRQPR